MDVTRIVKAFWVHKSQTITIATVSQRNNAEQNKPFFSVVHYPQQWREVLEDKDDNNKCSETFIFHVRRKCRYLVAALTIMLNSNLDHSTITINWE